MNPHRAYSPVGTELKRVRVEILTVNPGTAYTDSRSFYRREAQESGRFDLAKRFVRLDRFHLITRSALANTFGAIVRPISWQCSG
jgi:hypothetical protein